MLRGTIKVSGSTREEEGGRERSRGDLRVYPRPPNCSAQHCRSRDAVDSADWRLVDFG